MQGATGVTQRQTPACGQEQQLSGPCSPHGWDLHCPPWSWRHQLLGDTCILTPELRCPSQPGESWWRGVSLTCPWRGIETGMLSTLLLQRIWVVSLGWDRKPPALSYLGNCHLFESPFGVPCSERTFGMISAEFKVSLPHDSGCRCSSGPGKQKSLPSARAQMGYMQHTRGVYRHCHANKIVCILL